MGASIPEWQDKEGQKRTSFGNCGQQFPHAGGRAQAPPQAPVAAALPAAMTSKATPRPPTIPTEVVEAMPPGAPEISAEDIPF